MRRVCKKGLCLSLPDITYFDCGKSQGKNFVVVSDITNSFDREYDGLSIAFVSVADLVQQVQPLV